MKPHKQTTSAVSSIAGRYARMTNLQFRELCLKANLESSDSGPAIQFFRDIRKLAASCLAQDQTKAQGKP